MAGYVDGYVLPVPKKYIEAYRRLARKAEKIWKDRGTGSASLMLVELVELVK